VSQSPYPYGAPQDPANQPPADPFQQAAYPPGYPDAGFPDPGYQSATYPAQQPYPPTQPYQPGQYPGYPGQPTYPGYPPAQPPRRGATVAIITVVALLLVLVVGGGIAAAYLIPKNNKPQAQGSGTASPPASQTPSAPASPTPAPGPTHSGDLRTFLVPMPGGTKKCSNEEGTDGALSLSQAANLSTQPAKRTEELTRYKFTGGAVRCWVAGDGTVVDVRLYQFDSTDNAAGFFDADVQGTKPLYTTDNITDISGVPGGQSFANPTPDSNGDVQVISIGVRGDIVLVTAVRQSPPLKLSAAEGVLTAQYQKL
jgi:hypothetical protein